MIPPALERALYGLHATHVLHLADKHGVFPALAERPATATALAVRLKADGETLERMLLVLDSLGLVERAEDGTYHVPTAVRPYLDPAAPRYVGGFLTHMVTSTAERMPLLDTYLSAGKEAADAGRPAPFDLIYATPESTERFLTAMWQLSADVSRELAELAGLTGTRRLIDVGGAGGAFCVAALRAAPGLRATVFDLPQVGPHLEATARAHGLADRLDFVAGDFVAGDELPAGDCFAFGYVLSDWDDDTCVALLRKAHRACAPGGRVLVMERLFDDDRRGPMGTAVMNLSMHIETRGRHRTAAEYGELLDQAGFRPGPVHRSGQDKHVVTGHKPAAGASGESATSITSATSMTSDTSGPFSISGAGAGTTGAPHIQGET
ncbi:methyltransferase [Streptomyces sp. URMC 127]|uniref:methyltransferase n=1 Tax=Streptomyces sp. URMC 127 TaxID=3423402 RepID=UPI003F1AC3D8